MGIIKNKRLGKTNLFVSQIGLGGASIGNLYEECHYQDADNVINTCLDLGIRFFDTAPEYGHGLSERRMGDALRKYPRNEFVLATKVGELLSARHNYLPPENKFIKKLPFYLHFDYSYDGIMRSFEDSLQRLGLNSIDILFVHDLDPIIHDQKKFAQHFKIYVEEGYKALDKLRTQGVIQAIGLGVKDWRVCKEVMKYGHYDCFMLQDSCTLLDQPILNGFMELCESKHIGILIAGVFASGILATGPIENAYYKHKLASAELKARVQRIEEICKAYHTPLAAAAIQFPLRYSAITSVLIGSSSAALMKKNIDYFNFSIPPKLWNALLTENIIQPLKQTIEVTL